MRLGKPSSAHDLLGDMSRAPMSNSVPADARRAASHLPGLLLVAAGILLAATAGALLWWRQGETIFSTILTSALAWCF